MSFESLNLPAPILRAVVDSGYEQATEVQARAIPAGIGGADLRVSSATGSGKTAAFMIPALAKVLEKREAARAAAQNASPAETSADAGGDEQGEQARQQRRNQRRNSRFDAPRTPAIGPHVLVLAPTRELAQQVAKAAETYGRHIPGLRVGLVVGGMPYPAQLRMLRASLDVLIATPGRLIDHLESGAVRFGEISMLVLDEADRMLDMGFIEDIEHIAQALPESRQTLMFSATFAGQVGRLADQLMRPDAQRVEVSSHTERHDHIAQQLLWADDLRHKDALLDHILTGVDLEQAVVFTSTQRDADEVAGRLADAGHAVASLHGGMPQGLRNRTLMALRRGDLRVLVATDVAARGIDVPTITHVINYGLPMKAEDYVHRIGRTGRAGRSGTAITLAERQDASMIRRIQQFTTHAIPVQTREGLEPRRPVPHIDVLPRRPRGNGPGFGGPGGHRGGPRRDAGEGYGMLNRGGSSWRGEPRRAGAWDHGDDRRGDPRFDRGHGHAPHHAGAQDHGHAEAGRPFEHRGDRFADRVPGHRPEGAHDHAQRGPRGSHDGPRHFHGAPGDRPAGHHGGHHDGALARSDRHGPRHGHQADGAGRHDGPREDGSQRPRRPLGGHPGHPGQKADGWRGGRR